jgi:hypothetical protein
MNRTLKRGAKTGGEPVRDELTAFTDIQQLRMVACEVDLKNQSLATGHLRDRSAEPLKVEVSFNRSDASEGGKFVARLTYVFGHLPLCPALH